MVVVYPLKLEDELMPLIELKSKEEHTNKSIVLKQLIYHGLEEYVINLCSEGRISVGKAAEILGKSIYDIHRLAQEKGIVLTASEEQVEESNIVLQRLIKKKTSKK